MTDILEKSLRQLVKEINDPRRDVLLQIYDDHKHLFHFAAGARHNHQVWEGGYADHIAECLRINDVVYDSLQTIRPLPFTKASAAIALYLHDMEKPFRYGPKNDPQCQKWHKVFNDAALPSWSPIRWQVIDEFKKDYGLTLTDEETNALIYTHGEGSDYSGSKRVALPLAAHVHHCDNTSTRVWYDDGKGLSL